MIAGGLPSTDEGYYAYYAQLIHAGPTASQPGLCIPDAGPLSLYPLLLSWGFCLGGNPLVVLRLFDLIVALIATFLLFRVLEWESNSRSDAALLTLVFAYTMNQGLFVQYGFKNSIFAAYIPLLLAVRVAQSHTHNGATGWVVSGALTALGVLLREPLAPFAVLGFCCALNTAGWTAAFRFACGGFAMGLGVIGTVVVARGGLLTLLGAYHTAALMYQEFANQRLQLFLANGLLSLRHSAVALSLCAVAVGAAIAARTRGRAPTGQARYWLWGTASLLPLAEPTLKIGFPYHFAVCLPGIAGLTALSLRQTTGRWPSAGWFVRGAAIIGLVALLPSAITLAGRWPSTRKTLAAINSNQWPDTAIARSNYLLAAETIRTAAPPDATLSVSGFMYTLYPLTGRLPPKDSLSNLSVTLALVGFDRDRFTRILTQDPPDLVMTTTRKDFHGADLLKSAVEESGLYSPFADIPVRPGKDYGGFGGTIFRRKDLPTPIVPRSHGSAPEL